MANYAYGVKSICPFYLHEARMSITCEGFTEGTVNMTRFASKEDKKAYQAECCEMYNYAAHCPLAAALMGKYEDTRPTPVKGAQAKRERAGAPIKIAANGQLYWEGTQRD